MLSLSVFILAALVVLSMVFGIVVAALATRKGYSFAAWLGTGGLAILSAIALGILPNARDASLASTERARLSAKGNCVGIALSLSAILLAFLAVLAQLVSFPAMSNADHTEFFNQAYRPANQFFGWIQLLTLLVILAAYVARRRRLKSGLIIGSLIVLVLVEFYFCLMTMVETRSFIGELPVQFVYAATYSARIVHYFGFTGLCLGMLTALPMREEPII